MEIVKNRNIFFAIAALLMALSLGAVFQYGLKLGIDYTGGSILEIEYSIPRPDRQVIEAATTSKGIEGATIQPTGDAGFLIRTRTLTEAEHQALFSSLVASAGEGNVKELRFDTTGPTIGRELKQKSLTAIAIAIIAILCYIAFAFRKVSYKISSWVYGGAAIIALAHDILIPTGVFAVLGHFYGVEVDVLFVSALMTVLGFSIHDTIVVFDRVRENLLRYPSLAFEAVVERSVKETIARSINTSLTTVIVLVAVFFFGGASVKYFSLALILGISFGTYSSIFVASPLLVTWMTWKQKRTLRA